MESGLVDTEAGDQPARWGFVKKVYLVVLVQLIFTVPVHIFIGFDISPNFHVNPIFIALVPFGIAAIVMLCFRYIYKLRHKVPYNYICMVIYTIAVASVILFLASDIQIKKILIGSAIAVFVCALIFLFTVYGGTDTTGFNMHLISGIAFLVAIILMVLYFMFRYTIILLVIACFATVLFSFYLLFQNQLTLAKECKHAFYIDEYLWAAMNLYTDIVILACILTLMVHASFRIGAKEMKN